MAYKRRFRLEFSVSSTQDKNEAFCFFTGITKGRNSFCREFCSMWFELWAEFDRALPGEICLKLQIFIEFRRKPRRTTRYGLDQLATVIPLVELLRKIPVHFSAFKDQCVTTALLSTALMEFVTVTARPTVIHLVRICIGHAIIQERSLTFSYSQLSTCKF